VTIQTNSISLKLKNRTFGYQSFSFFNSNIEDLFFELCHYQKKDILKLEVKDITILDELTLNKRFMNVLSFHKIKKDENCLSLALAIENTEFEQTPIKKYRLNINLSEFELVLNKHLLVRVNFFVKNPIVISFLDLS